MSYTISSSDVIADTVVTPLVKTDQLRDQLRQILLHIGFVEEKEGEFCFGFVKWNETRKHKVLLPKKQHYGYEQWGYGREVLFRPWSDNLYTEWIINADAGHYKRFFDHGIIFNIVWRSHDQQEFLTDFRHNLIQMLSKV